MAGLRTEFEFVLPKGVVDDDGTVHRQGTMRLATARDELEPLNDPKVKDADDPYLTIIVLARVITGLGTRTRLSPKDVEGLFAADLAYLQDFYSVINFGTDAEIEQLQRNIAEVSRAARRSDSNDPAPAVRPTSPGTISADAAAAAIEARASALAAVEAVADAAQEASEGEGGAGAPTPRRRKTVAPADMLVDAMDVAEDDGAPILGEDGIELPTPRRNRIEEVGRTTERPRGAR
jgi:hypothetical protein